MHDIKGNKLQINSIESREEAVVVVETQFRNNPLLAPLDDNDLVPKWYVDAQISTEASATTVELGVSDLDTEYPDAVTGKQVIADSIPDNPIIYIKGSTTWWSIPLGSVAP
jgi:hypothetical protein